MLQQPALALYAAAIANQISVGSNHAMAGDDDRDWILAVGTTHSTHLFSIAQHLSHLSITGCLSIGDVAKLLPDRLLKVCALGIQVKRKLLQRTDEIILQLGYGATDNIIWLRIILARFLF